MNFLYFAPRLERGNIQKYVYRKWLPPQNYWEIVLKADLLEAFIPTNGEFDDYDYIISVSLFPKVVEYLKSKKYGGRILLIVEPHPPRWHNQLGGKDKLKKEINESDLSLLDCSPYVVEYRQLFGTEKIVWCPNPYNVEEMAIFISKDPKTNILATTGHCNYPDSFVRSCAIINGLPKTKSELEVWVFNEGRTHPFTNMPFIWDMEAHLKRLERVKVLVDDCEGGASMMTGHCACLGVPVVGNDHTDRQIHCFPELSCPPKNIEGMRAKILQLFDDPSFYEEMTRTGMENVRREYSFDACKNRLMKYLK